MNTWKAFGVVQGMYLYTLGLFLSISYIAEVSDLIFGQLDLIPTKKLSGFSANINGLEETYLCYLCVS